MDSTSADTDRRKRQYVPRVNHGGNYCGHSPDSPRLGLLKPVTGSDKTLPGILRELQERLERYYSSPNTLPSLRNANRSAQGRRMRSERREACLLLLKAIIAHTDLVSLRCGFPSKQGFISLTLDWLTDFTGLGLRRAERALADLKRANLITVSQPRQLQEDGTWKGLAAVKAVNRLLFTAFGLGRRLQHEKQRASDRLAKKVKKIGGTLTGWARNALVIGGIMAPKTESKAPPIPSFRPSRSGESPGDQDAYNRARLELLIALRQAHPERSAADINADADRILQDKQQKRFTA